MNYLIFRDDGIGDLIVSTSLMQSIKMNDQDAKIYLVCSNRNIELAKIIKNNDLIQDYINIDVFTSSIKGRILLFLKIKSLLIHHFIILKSSNLSFFISKLLNLKKISGIVPLKTKSNIDKLSHIKNGLSPLIL